MKKYCAGPHLSTPHFDTREDAREWRRKNPKGCVRRWSRQGKKVCRVTYGPIEKETEPQVKPVWYIQVYIAE